MVNIVLDASGRTVVPKKIRDQFDTNTFEVIAEGKKIILKPRQGILSLYGNFPELSVNNYLRGKKKEAARENSA